MLAGAWRYIPLNSRAAFLGRGEALPLLMSAGKKLLYCLAFAAAWPVCHSLRAETPAAPLTSADAALSLSAEEAAQRRKILLTGVVTAAEADWKGQFFVQDATGGIFVENLSGPPPEPGEQVVVEGVSHPGAFAPIVSAPQWRSLGRGPLPEPKRVPIEDLLMGAEDGRRIEVAGVVRSARLENGRLTVDLVASGHRLRVYARPLAEAAPDDLVACRVTVRGTAATHYIGALRHLTSVAIYVPRTEDFVVHETERPNPFDQPVIPINSVAQYRRGQRAEQRVHVRGAVTFQRRGREVFLQDSSGGIHIVTTSAESFAMGDQVEAVGFLEYQGHLPLLRDAALRRSAEKNFPVPPRAAPFVEIARGEHHGNFITLRGRVIDHSRRPDTLPSGRLAGVVATWLVQGPETTFTVEYPENGDDPALAAVPVGSLVEVDGVCVSTLEVDPTGGKLVGLRLLLPSPEALRVLERPSWFTPARLLAGLGIVSAVLLVVIGWLLTVSKKNAVLRRVVRELEVAQDELQEAHDTLEHKVVERSAQLQVEMTARKTAELQFKAVLAERTRLARDLHDTLEQTLAGIALRLNTAARLFRRDPDASDTHLQLARNWLHQSQVNLRRSIWDLRSRELEQFDLAQALRTSAEQLVQGTGIELDFQTKGGPRSLPEVVEENVLRVGQEALTNVAKHAKASRVSIVLEFDPRVLRLRIEDDGAGFEPALASRDGHFGLTGMAERAKRIAGGLVINSAPGRGTTLTLEVPLETADAPRRADATAHDLPVV